MKKNEREKKLMDNVRQRRMRCGKLENINYSTERRKKDKQYEALLPNPLRRVFVFELRTNFKVSWFSHFLYTPEFELTNIFSGYENFVN